MSGDIKPKIDVDFSLAINNRTGKYFLGKDIIRELGDSVGQVSYGRLKAVPKNDLLRRIHGRLFQWENLSRLSSFMSKWMPLQTSSNPMLHVDPLTVINHQLKSNDIVLCHDVGPITHPEYFTPQTEALYQKAYGKIKDSQCHLVFVSEHTRREFAALYGTNFASFNVIYIPVRANLIESMQDIGTPAVSYFLTVGSLGFRKNQIKSIEGFKCSGLHEQGYEYWLVGSREPGAAEVEGLAALTPGVKVLGYVSEDQLKQLYRQTSGFVLMSYLEGFGMPIVEAAGYGAPCLVSKGGIFSEIGGPSMLTADPDDAESIANQMRQMAELTIEERLALTQGALDHIRRFDETHIFEQWRLLVNKVLIMETRK